MKLSKRQTLSACEIVAKQDIAKDLLQTASHENTLLFLKESIALSKVSADYTVDLLKWAWGEGWKSANELLSALCEGGYIGRSYAAKLLTL